MKRVENISGKSSATFNGVVFISPGKFLTSSRTAPFFFSPHRPPANSVYNHSKHERYGGGAWKKEEEKT